MALESLTLGVLFDLSQAPRLDDSSPRTAVVDLFNGILGRGMHGLTLNINGWQTQNWVEQGNPCLDRLQALLRYGAVEMTGTAAHHPILPLLHPVEARRQVALNTNVHQRLLGDQWLPGGFFPPELAYGHELVPLLPSLGYRWCLSDDANFASLHDYVPFDWVPKVGSLAVLLRSRHWSQAVGAPGGRSGAQVAEELLYSCADWFQGRRGYLVLALPGQCLTQKGYLDFLWSFLEAMRSRGGVEVAHLSKIVDTFENRECEVPPGSWKSSVDDFWSGDFFAPWNSPEQSKHQILWRVTELAWASLERLREKLDVGMNSENFEWVSLNTPPPATLNHLLDVIHAGQPEQLPQAKTWLSLLGADSLAP